MLKGILPSPPVFCLNVARSKKLSRVDEFCGRQRGTTTKKVVEEGLIRSPAYGGADDRTPDRFDNWLFLVYITNMSSDDRVRKRCNKNIYNFVLN